MVVFNAFVILNVRSYARTVPGVDYSLLIVEAKFNSYMHSLPWIFDVLTLAEYSN